MRCIRGQVGLGFTMPLRTVRPRPAARPARAAPNENLRRISASASKSLQVGSLVRAGARCWPAPRVLSVGMP